MDLASPAVSGTSVYANGLTTLYQIQNFVSFEINVNTSNNVK